MSAPPVFMDRPFILAASIGMASHSRADHPGMIYDVSVMKELRFAFLRRPPAFAAREALCLAAVLALPGGAQNIPQPRGPLPQPIGQRVPGMLDDGSNGDYAEQQERLRAINRERQKSLVSDTNKLLKLATELDTEIQSENSGALTPTQMRKWATIEKLAHNVKDKMSYSVGGPSVTQPQSQPPLQTPFPPQ